MFASLPVQKGYRSDETFNLACDLYDSMEQRLGGDVVLDDRINTSIGSRLYEARLQGYPIAVCLGKKVRWICNVLTKVSFCTSRLLLPKVRN